MFAGRHIILRGPNAIADLVSSVGDAPKAAVEFGAAAANSPEPGPGAGFINMLSGREGADEVEGMYPTGLGQSVLAVATFSAALALCLLPLFFSRRAPPLP